MKIDIYIYICIYVYIEAALGRRGAALAALRARPAAQPPASSGAKVKIYIQIDR